jgi:DNA-binding CsgD family transcriptional regulator
MQMLDSAKVVVHHLFDIAKTSKEPDDELIAWEMTGRIAMQENDFTKAEKALLKSAAINNGRNKELLNRIYEALAECYEKMGKGDQAYNFLKLADSYNDSISEVKAAHSNRYLFIKAEYDKEQMRLRDLAEEKKKAIRNRNIGILSLLLLACSLIIWINHRKNRATRLQQKATKELERFKEEILAKNNRIEQLLADAGHRQQVLQDAHATEELSQQMILTEADWQNFKSLFEKTYPAFFRKLREKAPGITEAEQRMAALVKIQLTTRQIASMQGIGTDSVHKTRHRLRQRFGTETTAELETLIDEI